ncbi:MAG: hypothetical protein ACJASV_002718 [Pseudorhodobacter sp.]
MQGAGLRGLERAFLRQTEALIVSYFRVKIGLRFSVLKGLIWFFKVPAVSSERQAVPNPDERYFLFKGLSRGC